MSINLFIKNTLQNNLKIKLLLRSLIIAIFFGWIGPNLLCAFFALPNFLFIKDKESPSLLIKYCLRGLEASYFLFIFNIFMSLRYELNISYFYKGMSIYDRIGTSAVISVLSVSVIILIVMCFEFVAHKMKKQ